MKWIRYKLANGISKAVSYSEYNLAIVQKEAAGGEYTIEDDGEPAVVCTPTQLDLIEAQVAYTAMMTDTLLEG